MAATFQDRVIVITGATGTVGQGLARHFASRGARLVLTARNQDRLDAFAKGLSPGQVHARTADLSNPDSLRALESFLRDAVPQVDVLINNAADVTSKPLMDTSLKEIDGQIRTNVTGTLQLCRLLVPLMQDGMKRIVNISSLAGYKPNPAQTVYSISKSGVNAISAALHAELRAQGFHVLNVALMGIGDEPRQVPVSDFAARLERAVERRQHELFLYRRTKWLMRLYGLIPALARLR
ncbi:MAG: SDR family NAD(P)-dependent oxidoreductase [Candidatus Hydrogenedentes bacterium]|nr:SDR family NAD(P)-dependent oxidoreductase [Candidatus Hydrogenedentota bacterium]